MEIVKSKKYLKSLEKLPTKSRDRIEAEVDRLETNLTGVIKIQGTENHARLDVGDYRVFLLRQKEEWVNKQIIILLIVQDAVRRTTTTYKKRK